MSRAILFLLSLTLVSSLAVPTYPIDETCGPNEQFNYCASACQPSCVNPAPLVCTQDCIIGCECKADFFRNADGACVLTQDCPPVTFD